jgi:FkbM family methyltransferase
MNYMRKIRTLAGLIAQANGREIRRRWRQFINSRRVHKNNGKPFIHKDLGFPAVCHPDWPDSLHVYLDSAGDHFEMQLMRGWLELGEGAIDIGANVGLYTFCFADATGARGEVISVDADEFITEKMDEAVQILGQTHIQPVQAAVCEKMGSLEFFVSAGQTNTFVQSLVCPDGLAASYRAVTVPAVTISDLVSQMRDPSSLSLVKVDIEGAEASALRQAGEDLLGQAGPLWQVEINPAALRRFGTNTHDVTEMFPERSFDRWLLPKHPLRDGPGETAPRRLSRDESFEKSIYYNLICIPRGERWASRRDRLVQKLEGCNRGG